MLISWLLRRLPEHSLLERDAEQAFRTHKAREARKSSLIFALVSGLILLLFNLSDHLGGLPIYAPENLLRYAAVVSLLIPMIWARRISAAQLPRLWFAVAVLLVLLVNAVFYVSGLRNGALGVGGPAVLAVALGSVTFFHLGQKLLLWALQLAGLLLIEYVGGVGTGWSLFYLTLIIFLLSFTQYRLDLLQRLHFRYQMAERLKAETDKLTGALNRHSFEKRLSQLLSQLKPGARLCVGLLDIDHFKQYNDHYGHLKGDACLIAVSKALQELPLDLLVRFGGEEFIVVAVLDGDTPNWLLTLNQCIRALQVPHVASPTGCVTASVGLCEYRHLATQRLPLSEELLSTADKLLYQAKEAGRDCVHAALLETAALKNAPVAPQP